MMNDRKKYNILKFSSLDSTQTYLMSSDLSILPEWTVVIAHEQKKGRGQINNFWETEKGKNLTMSILLKPNFINISNQFLITQVLSLGIYDYLKKYIQDVSIKWPNDIYIGKKKICGILVNNKLQGEEFSYSICGIGLNVNQTTFSLAPNPTSIKIELGEDFDLLNLIYELLDYIFYRYNRLKIDTDIDYKKEYLSRLLNFNIWAKYLYEDKSVEAKIVDVNEYGYLKLLKRDKTIIEAELKKLKFSF